VVERYVEGATVNLSEEIKERLDIVDVISGYVPLTKAGRSLKGLCPFHTEKTPSFFVFPHTQTWHCFGACGEGGDVFTFLMKMENMEFREALRVLAQKAGIPLRAPTARSEAEDQKRETLKAINSTAATYFHHLLQNSDEGAVAREYLAGRGLAEETVRSFRLGYALERWDGLRQYLGERGYDSKQILEAGLVLEREGGGYYDRFRGRLIIPIKDHDGNVVGFSGRVLDDSQPKYMNSPQTPLFDKGSILFGVDQAKREIRVKDQVVIVEGYMDVMMAHQAGRKNVVASMGTALTSRQFRTLNRLTKRFVLALDADAAGQQAIERGIEVAWESLDSHRLPVSSKGGRRQSEYHLDADIRVLPVPEGKDPDDIIRDDVADWDMLVEGAPLAMDYVLERTLDGLDADSPVSKSRAAGKLLPIIARIGDRVQQAHYIQELARITLVPEKELLRQAALSGKPSALTVPDSVDEQDAGEPRHRAGAEEYCLGLISLRPDLLGGDLEIKPEYLSRPENRAILSLVDAELRQGRPGPQSLGEIQELLDSDLRQHLDQVLVDVEKWMPESDEEISADLENRLLELRRGYWLRRQLELQYSVGQDADPEERRAHREMSARCSRELNRIAKEQYQRTLKGQRDLQRSLVEEGGGSE
jgi:DNA primase